MKRWFVIISILAFSIPPALAQSSNPKKQPPAEAEAILKIDTQEVMLPVSVRDRAGQFVTNLKAGDFKIYEDNSLQPITSFTLKQMPVNVVLLIDTSSSVTKELEDFKQAALSFANKLDPQDQLALLKFDDKVELVMDWTMNRAALRRALHRLTTGMFTDLNDALWLTANEQFKQVIGRKAIIVLTDGIDSGRGLKTSEQALRAVLESEAPVYAISKTEIQRSIENRNLEYYEKNYSLSSSRIKIDGLKMSLAALDQGERWLTRLAEETGGRIFLPTKFEELEAVYQQVADELRNQYVIYYTPNNSQRDGRYRAVRVKVKDTNYHVTSRLGYYPR